MDIPKVFGERFTVGEQIVKRPNCIVYKGTDGKLGDREVAIKVFLDQPVGSQEWINEFNEDIQRLRSTSHQSLVPIVGGGCENDWFYLVMELISGNSLREVLKEHAAPLSTETAVSIFSELAAGLRDLHENQVWHGHIDSRAVLFKGDSVRLAGYYPRVIAKIQKSKSSDGRMVVEPAYIAPEQITGTNPDHRADIFALAVLLFEMVTGKRPFEADNPVQCALLRLSKEPPRPAKLNPALPPLLDAAIMKGLVRDPNERYSSVAEFVEAVTGGKKQAQNPLSDMAGDTGVQMTGTQTIGVSMSTDAIREILRSHEKGAAEPKAATSAGAAPQQGGVMETMVGRPAYTEALGQRQAASGSGGSFIVLSGDLRGKRFPVAGTQAMIGSDSACDICVSGKGIPPRYAIVTEKDGRFYAGPLSPAGITINGSALETAEDVLLKRGDVLTVGPHRLRFVEPKEVFTLQDEAADRVIDRAQSKAPKLLGIAAGTAVVLCLLLFLAYQATHTEKKVDLRQEQAKQELERKALITKLRNEGDQLFKSGALLEPPDVNARKRFEQILELDPDEPYAKRRLREIEERVRALAVQAEQREKVTRQVEDLLAQGDRFFLAKNYIVPPGANARDSYQAVLRLDPANERAKSKIGEIDKLLGDLVARVNNLLAQARSYQAMGSFVSPQGQNAYELLNEVLAIDPENAEAKNLIYAMAAQSIVQGDQAKNSADTKTMRRSYLVAQALGVDPEYLKPRMRGTELIERARSEMIFVDRPGSGEKKASDGKYLDRSELERRMAEFEIPAASGTQKGRRFVDVNSLQ